jgi:3-hydroxyisobutyrate dehydrogenase-like beta-hydroxyacid dehydrogenase
MPSRAVNQHWRCAGSANARAAQAKRKVRYVEAPITGGVTLLRAGKMTVYLSGEPEDVEAALPFVQPYTATQLPMGGRSIHI